MIKKIFKFIFIILKINFCNINKLDNYNVESDDIVLDSSKTISIGENSKYINIGGFGKQKSIIINAEEFALNKNIPSNINIGGLNTLDNIISGNDLYLNKYSGNTNIGNYALNSSTNLIGKNIFLLSFRDIPAGNNHLAVDKNGRIICGTGASGDWNNPLVLAYLQGMYSNTLGLNLNSDFGGSGYNYGLTNLGNRNNDTNINGKNIIINTLSNNSKLNNINFSGINLNLNSTIDNYENNIYIGNLKKSNIYLNSKNLSSGFLCIDSSGKLINCPSSIKYKENIESIDISDEDFKKLNIIKFDYIDINLNKQVGLIAEEVNDIDSLKFLVIKDENNNIESLDYNSLYRIVTLKLIELMNKFDKLQNEFKILKKLVKEKGIL